MLNRVPLFPKSLVRFSSLHCVHAALLQRTLLTLGCKSTLNGDWRFIKKGKKKGSN